MSGGIKGLLKKNKLLIKIYEIIFTPVHWMKFRIENSEIQIPSMEKTHFSYGSLNKDKKFFVIQYDRPECGIISMIFHVLPKIDWAVKRNYIPIVDCRKNYLELLQDSVNAGKENAWEYYFEQPAGQYSLDEVYQSRHVIYERKRPWHKYRFCGYSMFPMEKKEYDYWSELIQKYIHPSRSICERIEKEKEKIPPLEECMGVFIRAGYRFGGLRKHPLFLKHPKVGSCETYINEIRKLLKEWNCPYFFLACDDRWYSDQILNAFNKQCIRVEQPLKHFFERENLVEAENVDVEFEKYTVRKRNEDYITELLLLSQCNSLFSCVASGAQFVYLLNKEKYKFLKIQKEGLWLEKDFK